MKHYFALQSEYFKWVKIEGFILKDLLFQYVISKQMSSTKVSKKMRIGRKAARI